MRKGGEETAPQTPLGTARRSGFLNYTRDRCNTKRLCLRRWPVGGRAPVFIYHRTSKSAEGRQQLTAGKQSYLRTGLVIDVKPKPIVLQLFTQRRAKPLAVLRVIVSSTTKCADKKRIATPRGSTAKNRWKSTLTPESILHQFRRNLIRNPCYGVSRFNRRIYQRATCIASFSRSRMSRYVRVLFIFSQRRGRAATLIDTSPFIPLNFLLILHSHMRSRLTAFCCNIKRLQTMHSSDGGANVVCRR